MRKTILTLALLLASASTRHYAGRCKAMDRDNLGVKPLVDALVREGVVHDDDAAHLELHVLQERGMTNVTHVLVEELA